MISMQSVAPLEFIPEVWLSVKDEGKKRLEKVYVIKARQNDLDILSGRLKVWKVAMF